MGKYITTTLIEDLEKIGILVDGINTVVLFIGFLILHAVIM
jgi:hypothetical protein